MHRRWRRASVLSSGTPSLPKMSMPAAATVGALAGAGLAGLLRFAGTAPAWWQVAGAMAVLAAAAQEPAQRMIGSGRLDNRLTLRTASAMAQFALVLDLCGLGFLLPVCGVTIAAVHIQWSGSKAWRPIEGVMACVTVCNLALMWFGIVPSIVPPRMALAVSPMILGIAVLAIANIGLTTQARERVALRLAHVASHDGLTGLLNRGEFCERALAALPGVSPESPAALLFCDLDGFNRRAVRGSSRRGGLDRDQRRCRDDRCR